MVRPSGRRPTTSAPLSFAPPTRRTCVQPSRRHRLATRSSNSVPVIASTSARVRCPAFTASSCRQRRSRPRTSRSVRHSHQPAAPAPPRTNAPVMYGHTADQNTTSRTSIKPPSAASAFSCAARLLRAAAPRLRPATIESPPPQVRVRQSEQPEAAIEGRESAMAGLDCQAGRGRSCNDEGRRRRNASHGPAQGGVGEDRAARASSDATRRLPCPSGAPMDSMCAVMPG